MTWHPATKITAIAGGLAVVVLLLTGEQESGGSAVAALPRAEPTPIREIAEPLLQPKVTILPELDILTAMVERPLFASTRRQAAVEMSHQPQVVVDMRPVPVVIPEPEMTFVGTLVRDNDVLALVTRGYDGSVESIGIGEEIDGWKVVAIDDRAVSLALEDRHLKFSIFE